MGILRLFRHLLNSYKNFYTVVNPQAPHTFDVVLLDLNAIFHPASRDVYFPKPPGGFVNLLRPPKQPPKLSDEELELQAFEAICRAIETIVKICKPRRCLYLAIDGVAGMCKQSQQRKRRYKGASARLPGEFDTANITAGTPWMARLCKYIAEWIQRSKQTFLANVQVIYSDMYVEGEGEHKLIRYLGHNATERTTYCVYSPDADLIMLCMCLSKGTGYILRENIYDDIKGKWLLVDCTHLKQQISTHLNELGQITFDSRRVVRDYVLYLMLVGNDFLPSLYCLEIGNDGISTLQASYVATAIKEGYLVTEVNTISKQAFTELFKHLTAHEPSLCLKKYHKGSKYPDDLLNSCIAQVAIEGTAKTTEAVDFAKLRKAYYEQKFKEFDWSTPDANIKEICRAYLRGLNFVLTYYAVSIPTYEWCYEYHYAPLMCDMYNFVSKMSQREWNVMQEWSFKPPLTLNQALIGIMPPSSASLLPQSIQQILTNNKDHELFSEDFEVDLQGKWQDYEGICLLPNVPYATLKKICKDTNVPHEPSVFS